MSDKLPKLPNSASPDEVMEAIMSLFVDWFDDQTERSVIISIVDQNSTDPDGNSVSWAAGNVMMQGAQIMGLIAGLHPVAKLMLMSFLHDGKTGLMATLGKTDTNYMERNTLDEFKKKFGGEAPRKATSPFDGLDEIEFMEGNDE